MKRAFTFTLIIILCGCSKTSFTLNPLAKKKVETKPTIDIEPPKTQPIYNKKAFQVKPDMSPYKDYRLHVSISDGNVNFHNIDSLNIYNPTQLVLQDSENKSVTLSKQGDNFFRSQSNLLIHYQDGILALDTELSPYAIDNVSDPSVYFYFDPSWLQGKSYHNINSYGFAELTKVTITLHLVPA